MHQWIADADLAKGQSYLTERVSFFRGAVFAPLCSPQEFW
jgi:hypothetical protein